MTLHGRSSFFLQYPPDIILSADIKLGWSFQQDLQACKRFPEGVFY